MTGLGDRVGIIGLGAMGLPMAANLLRSGFDLVVHDKRPEASAGLVAAGAAVAGSPAEVARQCGIVHVIVLTEVQLDTVLFGEPDGGVIANLSPGAVVLVHSTVSPGAVAAAAERAAQRSVHLLDAPVTGSIKGAQDGSLTFIVGGADEPVERCEKVLAALGSRTIRVGLPGLAQIAKLINNMLAGVNSVAIAEGLALARSAGLDETAALEVVNAGTGASFMSTHRDLVLQMGRSSDLVGIGYKDLRLALDEAHGRDVHLPTTAVATQFLAAYHTAEAARKDMP